MALGETLAQVQRGMAQGRALVWDEAARKMSTLLLSPAAAQGEHFLQVFLCFASPPLLNGDDFWNLWPWLRPSYASVPA